MKQYALLDKENGLYYNFISNKWSKFLTYGCLYTSLPEDYCLTGILSWASQVEIIIDKSFMANNNRVVDEVLVF